MNNKIADIIKNKTVSQFIATDISLENGSKFSCKLNVNQSIIKVQKTKFISLITSKCLDTYFSEINSENEEDEIELPQAFHVAEEEEQLTNGELFSDYSQEWTSQKFDINPNDDNFDAKPLIGEDRNETEVFFFLLPLLFWKEVLASTNWKKFQLKVEGDSFTIVELLTYVNIRLSMAINRKNSKDRYWDATATGYAPGFNFSKIMAL